VLGLSAIDAGITLAVQPLVTMFTSGVAAALSQKVNGKYLLIPGLIALAAGSAYIDWVAQAGSGRWDFTPGLIASGLGMGFIWTPVFSIATRDLPAHLGGAASGVVNTIQELGGVMASAIVGAFLQNRLADALHHQPFPHAFVAAMRPTLVLPIAVLVVAALATFFVRAHPPVEMALQEEQAAVA
jgi:hypothetical protein